MKKVLVVLMLALLTTVMTANPLEAKAKWTIMVFINADNNLESAGIDDVNEMEKIGSTDDVQIIALLDRIPGYDSSNGNWTGTKMFHIQKDNDPRTITSPVLKDMGEVDTGKYSEVVDFVKYCKTNFPAENYYLAVWNHGAGWKKKEQQETLVKGISYDDTDGSHITTLQLETMAREINQVLGKNLDILNYDACLMQMAEIVYQTRDYIDFVIAAEETEPGDGDPYDDIFGPLVQNPNMTAREFSIHAAKAYVASYSGGSQGNSSVCKSAVDSKLIDDVALASDEFAKALIKVMPSEAQNIKTAMYQTQKYAYSDYKDLYHFAQLTKGLVADADVKAGADLVMEAVTKATIHNGVVGYKVKNSFGLAVYIPQEYQYRKNYKDLAWSQDTAWDKMLNAYFAATKTKEGDEVNQFVRSLKEATEPAHADMIFDEIVIGMDQNNHVKLETFIGFVQSSEKVSPIMKAVYIKLKSVLVFMANNGNEQYGEYLNQLNAIIIE